MYVSGCYSTFRAVTSIIYTIIGLITEILIMKGCICIV